MSSFDSSDSGTYRDLEEIQNILSQIENKAEEVLENFKSKKDQRPFEPGNVNLDSLGEIGDPRRPNLTSIIANIVLDSVSPTETAADIQATVEELTGDDVSDADITEIVYKILDNSDTEVASDTYEFDQSNDPVTNTSSLTGLSAGTGYDAQVELTVNGDTKDIESAGFSTPSSTLYDPSNWGSMDHYYALNNDFADSAGSLDLSAVNSPSFVSAVDQEGIALNGTDQYLENSSFSFNPTSAFSAVGWLNVNTVPSGDVPIAGLLQSGGGTPDIALGIDDTPNVLGAVNAGGSASVLRSGQVQTGTKHFIAVTYDGSNLEIYLDGSTPIDSTAKSGDIANNADYFWVGQDPNGPRYLDANYIDEIALFSKGLTDSEIDTLYQAGA